MEFPWAGLGLALGAILAGLGSLLSGYAALKTAERKGNNHEDTDNPPVN